MPMSATSRLLVRLGVTAGVVVGVGLMLRGLALDALADALARARVWPLIAASAIALAVYVFKAISWRIMLAPRFDVSLPRLVRYTVIAFAASAIAPARAGELVRVWLLKQRDQVDAATSVAVATSEKALDAVSLLVLAAPLPWLLPLPAWVAQGLLALTALLAVAVGVIAFTSRGIPPRSWPGRVVAALERRPRQLARVFVALLVGWLIDLGAVILVLYALDLSTVPWSGALLVLVVVNVAISIPSTPAQIGTLELGALIPLVDILHVAKEPAIAFALVYHATQIVPTLIIGLALEWRLVLGRGAAVEAPPGSARSTFAP